MNYKHTFMLSIWVCVNKSCKKGLNAIDICTKLKLPLTSSIEIPNGGIDLPITVKEAQEWTKLIPEHRLTKHNDSDRTFDEKLKNPRFYNTFQNKEKIQITFHNLTWEDLKPGDLIVQDDNLEYSTKFIKKIFNKIKKVLKKENYPASVQYLKNLKREKTKPTKRATFRKCDTFTIDDIPF